MAKPKIGDLVMVLQDLGNPYFVNSVSPDGVMLASVPDTELPDMFAAVGDIFPWIEYGAGTLACIGVNKLDFDRKDARGQIMYLLRILRLNLGVTNAEFHAAAAKRASDRRRVANVRLERPELQGVDFDEVLEWLNSGYYLE